MFGLSKKEKLEKELRNPKSIMESRQQDLFDNFMKQSDRIAALEAKNKELEEQVKALTKQVVADHFTAVDPSLVPSTYLEEITVQQRAAEDFEKKLASKELR